MEIDHEGQPLKKTVSPSIEKGKQVVRNNARKNPKDISNIALWYDLEESMTESEEDEVTQGSKIEIPGVNLEPAQVKTYEELYEDSQDPFTPHHVDSNDNVFNNNITQITASVIGQGLYTLDNTLSEQTFFKAMVLMFEDQIHHERMIREINEIGEHTGAYFVFIRYGKDHTPQISSSLEELKTTFAKYHREQQKQLQQLQAKGIRDTTGAVTKEIGKN
ncbi:hypothetical protein DFH27DRAFT_618898 [Peziza echinospora]|nr:hypothetical protein DFH27DRAFT_618898 [Peziza echinospora]